MNDIEQSQAAERHWRLAESLLVLRGQVNGRWPKRCTVSDWTADREPRIPDGDYGVVTAIDIGRDLGEGFDSDVLARSLIASRDRRIKHVISNGHVASQAGWVWLPYDGEPHVSSVHVAVMPDKADYDSPVLWDLDAVKPAAGS